MAGVAAGPGVPAGAPPEALLRTIPWVSPLRGGGIRGTLEVRPGQPARPIEGVPRPPEPRVEPAEPPSVAALEPDHEEEPALPDEARRRVVAAEAAPTPAIEAHPGQALHVRFALAAHETLVSAFQAIRELIHDHPGETPVVLHIPSRSGRAEPMELRLGVAYDAELLADVQRRLGEGLVTLELGARG